MADIFLSYARQDRARIARLADRLEAAGHSLWWDRQIDGGSEFSADIERELAAAGVVIVAWSKHSVVSHWVRDEAGVAQQAGKLVAISLDGTPPPMGFKQLHAIDMRSDEGEADLMRSLAHRLGQDPPSTTHAHRQVQGRRWKAALLVIPLLLVIAGLGFWAWQSGAGEDTAAAAESAAGKSVAILPFRDLSPEPQQWFTDGLAQEIASTLSRAPDIEVAPSAASFRFREREETFAEMGEELGVTYILDGSIRRSDERIVVDIELVDVASGEQAFTQRYDRPLADTISVQEDIATRVANALDTALDPEALAELLDVGTNSVEAYEEWLRAFDVIKNGDLDATLVHIERAIEFDPAWSIPHVNAAEINTHLLNRRTAAGSADRSRLSERTRYHLDRATELARNEIQRDHAAFARHMFYGETRDLVTLWQRLMKEEPDGGHDLSLAHFLLRLGEVDRAVEVTDEYVQRDPEGRRNAANLYNLAGAHEKVLAINDSLSAELREDWGFQGNVHQSLIAVGRLDEARQLLTRIEASPLDDAGKAMARVRLACATGDRQAAMKQLPALKGNPFYEAHALHLLGRTGEAVAVQKQYDYAEPPYPLLDQLGKTQIDPSRFPNLEKVIERERISVKRIPTHLDNSCPA